MIMSAFNCYRMYLAIKNHFNSDSYDYAKYQGKMNIKEETFLKRRDKWFFIKLTKTYAEEDMLDLMVSNFLEHNGHLYIMQLLETKAGGIMLEHKRKKQALSYVFSSDLDALFSKVEIPDDLLRIEKGKNPPLLKAMYTKEINLETFVILNDLMSFFPMFDKKLGDEFLWPEFKKKCNKYKGFLDYDKDKFEKILKEKINGI